MAAHYEQDGQASQAIEGGEMGLCLAIETRRGAAGGWLRGHVANLVRPGMGRGGRKIRSSKSEIGQFSGS
jgi:hypothetical protein